MQRNNQKYYLTFKIFQKFPLTSASYLESVFKTERKLGLCCVCHLRTQGICEFCASLGFLVNIKQTDKLKASKQQNIAAEIGF